MSEGINGVGVALLIAGGALAYSAIKGKSTADTIRQALKGDTAALAVGTSLPPVSTTNGVTVGGSSTVNGATVVGLAKSQLGKPYIFATPWNPATPNPSSFDCSGLVQWCYYRIGAHLSHYSPTQYLALQHRPISQAQPGDVIFYSHFGTGGTAYHCAICIGGNQLIEAPDVGIPVRVRNYGNNDTDIVSTVGICPGI